MAKEFTSFTDERLESSLLASIFARPETYWEIVDFLPLEVFVKNRNRKIYKQLIAAIENDLPLPEFQIQAPPPLTRWRLQGNSQNFTSGVSWLTLYNPF